MPVWRGRRNGQRVLNRKIPVAASRFRCLSPGFSLLAKQAETSMCHTDGGQVLGNLSETQPRERTDIRAPRKALKITSETL